MTKIQKLFQIAKGFDKENNHKKYIESIELIRIEFKKIINKVKEKIAPLKPLTIKDFKASNPLTGPFLSNTFRSYDDIMVEVKQIFEEEGINFSLIINMPYCDQIINFYISYGDYTITNDREDMDGAEFDDIDFEKIINQIYDYLNIYPVLVLLGAYEVANNEEYESLKVYDFEWDS